MMTEASLCWKVNINLPGFLGKRSSVSAGKLATIPGAPFTSAEGNAGVMVNVGGTGVGVRVGGSITIAIAINVFASVIGWLGHYKDICMKACMLFFVFLKSMYFLQQLYNRLASDIYGTKYPTAVTMEYRI